MSKVSGYRWLPVPDSPHLSRGEMTVPGYDCRVKCKHHITGQHGVKSDEWFFCIRDSERRVALELGVYSGVYPDAALAEEPRVGSLYYHSARPWREEDIRSGEPEQKQCSLVGGPCFNDMFSSYAERFMEDHGLQPVKRPPEKFWVALQRELENMRIKLIPTTEQCTHCMGSGLVPVGSQR